MRPYNQSKRPYLTVERSLLNKNWLLIGLFFSTIAGFLTLVHQYKIVSAKLLKSWCLMLIHDIRCFYGPCIRPRMQKNLCFEQCLDLDFIAKVAVIMWLWAALWLGIKNHFGLFLFSGFFWGNPCEDIHPVKMCDIDCRNCFWTGIGFLLNGRFDWLYGLILVPPEE